MLHKGGARAEGGDLPDEDQKQIEKLLDEFATIIERIADKNGIRRGYIRSLFVCNLAIVVDSENIFVIAQREDGMPKTIFYDKSHTKFTTHQISDTAKWDLGFDDPFVIQFPKLLLTEDEGKRHPVLEAIAQSHVESEFQRVIKMTSLIQINPLFGPASYSIDEKFVFTLMPFRDDLTKIYNNIIKPTVEDKGFICRRADDLKTNRVIIQDIWKAICESRFVIADLTLQNPNVMYELGIAHTVGKETILINQVDESKPIKFPFDITHIRRIQYENSATGGRRLQEDLSQTIENLMEPTTISE